MKDAPSISPVSYPTRSAPLPDDKPEGEKGSEEIEKETKQIESNNRVFTRRTLVPPREERMKVPFPLLIKPKSKQKESNPALDLLEAIKLIKVNP